MADEEERKNEGLCHGASRAAQPCKRYKLHMGWLHYDEKKKRFRQVHAKNGGGPRLIQYEKDEPESVQSLLGRGKSLFFPDGKSCHGYLKTMKVCLSSYDGTEITELKDKDGKNSTLQDYLKAQGIFSSQYYIYLKTENTECETVTTDTEQKQDTNSEMEAVNTASCDMNETLLSEQASEKSFLVNGNCPPLIEIRYSKAQCSQYDGSEHFITCHSMKSCYEFVTRKSQNFEQYNPFEDGFQKKYLKIGDQQILDKTETGEIRLFGGKKEFDNLPPHIAIGSTVLFTPQYLHGYETSSDRQQHLILAVVSNQIDPYTHWYRNKEELFSGINMSAIHIHQPGTYTVGLRVGDLIHQVSPHVTVTIGNENVFKTPDIDVDNVPLQQQSSDWPEKKETEHLTTESLDSKVHETLHTSGTCKVQY